MTRRHTDGVKRMSDVAASALLIMITAPLQLALALVVRKYLGRPVLFRQDRPGLDAKLFTLIKFRTMTPIDQSQESCGDEDRLTSLGSILRRTSLDELPSLWNVLKGDMSLVGPRPLLPEYLERYSPAQARRHEVRPGVTGLAQVSGRNAISWEDRLAMDVVYVDQRSLSLDIWILWCTIRTVVFRQGTTAPGHATMPIFTGSPTSPVNSS